MLSILSLDLLGIVRSIWNIIFGTIMILLQLNWKQFITRNFGFLHHWFLRGCFYLFVGTNVMHTDGTFFPDVFFSLSAGFASCFVGVVELLFGFKCAPENKSDGDVEGGNKPGARHTVEPTLTVNLTPNQVGQAAQWAAANPGTTAAVANAVGGAAAAGAAAASSGGGAAANPFFGNAHLSNQR